MPYFWNPKSTPYWADSETELSRAVAEVTELVRAQLSTVPRARGEGPWPTPRKPPPPPSRRARTWKPARQRYVLLADEPDKELNTAKTKLSFFGPGVTGKRQLRQFQDNPIVLNGTTTCTYLGVTLDSTLNLKKSTTSHLREIQILNNKTEGGFSHLFTRLYTATARPTTLQLHAGDRPLSPPRAD